MSGYKTKNNFVSEYSNQNPKKGFKPMKAAPGYEPVSSMSTVHDGFSDYNNPNIDFHHSVLKYINDMLMEEEMGEKPCMLQDCLALQAAEKSFYDLLGQDYPPRSDQVPSCLSQQGSPDDGATCSESIGSCNSYSSFTEQSRGSKNREREEAVDIELEERRNKQSLVKDSEESEQLEILDKSFLLKVENKELMPCPLYDATRNAASKKLQQGDNLQQISSFRMKRQVNSAEKIDLWGILTQCARSTASGDQQRAKEQLRVIRQHSTPFGDGNQRVAHYLANGLEARLDGTQNMARFFGTGSSVTTMADVIRAYQLYVSVCPFRRMTNTFANRTISKVAEAEKAATLHIIDFGISYGFQWPCLIHRMSTRPGGPPKIRMTGIDFPQPGFRPSERVEETGRRLKRLADKFNVQFKFNVIAQKWETIRYEDLKIDKDNEVVAVNCMYRLKNLPDDTMVNNSSRDTVLKLIKQINPSVFVHGIANGGYNAPFFGTRFREALYHYSTIFDMLEATVTREDQERLVYEREIVAKEATNVIACEGYERIERPETYKQWQARNLRLGFVQQPLCRDFVKKVKKVKGDFHKEYLVDEDGQWLLLGWKGRMIHALSVWKPLQD